MRIQDVKFAPGVIEKLLQKHHIMDYEVREVFANSPRFRFVEKGEREGEDVYSVSGRTEAGRYLVIFFIYKFNQDALVISARNMDGKERRRYGKK
jgi:uncharacterized DUF497 family protein